VADFRDTVESHGCHGTFGKANAAVGIADQLGRHPADVRCVANPGYLPDLLRLSSGPLNQCLQVAAGRQLVEFDHLGSTGYGFGRNLGGL